VRPAREGDPAPGVPGATLNSNSNDNLYTLSFGPNAFNNSGQGIMQAELKGGGVTVGVDDRMLYQVSSSGLTPLMRPRVPAADTDGNFDTINIATLQYNNSGQIAFWGTLTGGTQTATTDTGLWTGTPGGQLRLVVREGDPAPGTNGAVLGDMSLGPHLQSRARRSAARSSGAPSRASRRPGRSRRCRGLRRRAPADRSRPGRGSSRESGRASVGVAPA